MPEIIADKQVFTLKEVALSIQKTIANRYGTPFWVKAEMNKLNYYRQSGHCYPDMLQKEDGKVVAQIRALVWKHDFEQISKRFLAATGEEIRDGITILFCGQIIFDPNHGLSIRIIDIDPSFTLGELEREKRACIQRLKDEGIFEANKSIKFPLLPKRLAIISVESSKGYADFIKLTEGRMNGFKIEHFLFPSLLQGERSVELMIKQLINIKKVAHHFDLVAIIRGGGGEIGLSTFNNYQLAKTIAGFPLPVITGIGHATNMTVCEMVAHTNAITPSELADLLLERFEYVLHQLHIAAKAITRSKNNIANEQQLIIHQQFKLISSTKRIQLAHQHAFKGISKLIQIATQAFISHAKEKIRVYIKEIQNASTVILSIKKAELKNQVFPLKSASNKLLLYHLNLIGLQEKTVDLLHPSQVLKRGYSITMMDGKVVTNGDQVKVGSRLSTIVSDGQIESIIDKIDFKKPNI